MIITQDANEQDGCIQYNSISHKFDLYLDGIRMDDFWCYADADLVLQAMLAVRCAEQAVLS